MAASLLSEIELERYRRQMLHDGFDCAHQAKLKNSTALVAGVGGLGGTAALYLAVAGIGKLVLSHYGKLTLSNMNRQVLMKHDSIGLSRVMEAKAAINAINPDVSVEVFDERINDGTVRKRLRGCNIALSTRPNFYERRILNAACVEMDVPLIEAAMNGMEGYMFNVIPGKTPCLNCVYPEDDPGWEELGFPVLGAVSGTLGCLMAIEAVKLLTGYGKPLIGQMLIFNTIDMEFRKLSLHRDEACRVCGQKHSGFVP